MSWESFLTELNEELASRKDSDYNNDEIVSSFLQNVAEELEAKERQDEAIGDTLKKAGQAVKGAWQKAVKKLKQVALNGFRFGVAIGQTAKGKFVLFNKQGEFLTPPAENIQFAKTTSGKRSYLLEYNLTQASGHNAKTYLSERLDFGFTVGYDKNGSGFMHVVDPKKPGVQEGIDYSSREILDEAEKEPDPEELQTMASIDSLVFDSVNSEKAMNALANTAENPPKIAPVEVNYQDFKKELKSVLGKVKEGRVLKGGKIKNLGIYAPTGWGKSQIIENVAKEMGYHYFPLELQKVPLEILQGFPYLSDVNEYDELDDETKDDRKKAAQKVVKMAPSEYLPPSGEQVENWLLFFDEFNRADTDKMAAVMNLLLTGELGGATSMKKGKDGEDELERYKLPKKVVIIMAMNTAEQSGVEETLNQVNDLDIATLERAHRILEGKYNAPSWVKSFAGKPYNDQMENGEEFWLKTRVPPIILNYINDQMQTKKGAIDPEKPFLLPVDVQKGKGGGGQRTTSPRSWTVVADRMIENGKEIFDGLDKETKEEYRPRAKEIMKDIQARWKKQGAQGKGTSDDGPPDDSDAYLFAAWMEDATNQIDLLAKEAPEFGDEGKEYIQQMITSFKKKAQEGVSELRLLLDYKNVRNIVKKNFKSLGFGTKTQFLSRLYSKLAQFSNAKEVKDYMEANGFQIISTKGSTDEEKIISQIYSTVKKLTEDIDLEASDLATFAHKLDAGKNKNEFLKKLFRKFNGQNSKGEPNWTEFREAAKTKTTTKSKLEKEYDKSGEEGQEGQEGEENDTNESLTQLFDKLKGM